MGVGGGVLWFQVLGGQRHLTAVLGDRLLPEAGGLSKALLEKLDDHVPHSAQHLADFERVRRPGCVVLYCVLSCFLCCALLCCVVLYCVLCIVLFCCFVGLGCVYGVVCCVASVCWLEISPHGV